jgi:biopolymer transport protein ExbD
MSRNRGETTPIKESGALTIVLTENGKMYYYQSLLNPANVHACSLKEIKNVILDKKRRTPEKDFFVGIKATDKASYGNIVDVLDENENN